MSDLTTKKLSALDRSETRRNSSVSEQQKCKLSLLKGLPKKGSPLNQKTSFCTCSQLVSYYSHRDGLGQHVAVDINA